MEPETLTPYAILGVSPYADEATIAAAFRARMVDVHPDRAHDEADRARRTQAAATVSAAYRLLRDPEARADLDLELMAADSWGWRIGRLKAAIGRRRAPRVPRPSFRVPEMRMPEVHLPDIELPFSSADVAAAGARSSSWVRAVFGFLLETRIGQWLLLLGVWGVPAIVDAATGRGISSQILLVLLGGIGALLARRGAPSPAHDAAGILLPLAERFGRGLLRTGARVAVGASVGAVRAARESKAWQEQMAEQVRREMAEAERGERRRPRDDRDGRYLREARGTRDDERPIRRPDDLRGEARFSRRDEDRRDEPRFSRRDDDPRGEPRPLRRERGDDPSRGGRMIRDEEDDRGRRPPPRDPRR